MKKEIENPNELALARMLNFLSIRPRSTREMRDYGRKKNIPENLVTNFIKKMEKIEYLDDFKFARLWVRDRQKMLGLGRSRIKRELLQKGVDREIVDRALEAEYSLTDEKNGLLKFVQKKKNVSREKILAALLRRGFDYQTVKKVLPGANHLAPASGEQGDY